MKFSIQGLTKAAVYSQLSLLVSRSHPVAGFPDEDPVTSPTHGKIVGGEPVTKGTYPWFASLTTSSGFFYCGAQLIAPDIVLTAAHCNANFNSEVIVGSFYKSNNNGGQFSEDFSVKKVFDHPDFAGQTSIDFDFSIIKIIGNSTITPVPIDFDQLSDGFAAGKDLWTIGFGTTSSGGSATKELRHVEVGYVPNDVCASAYGASEITDDMMCAAAPGKDACQGDSGGPLLDKTSGKVVGIVSWGYGCADPVYPGVYSRISAAADWIRKTACVNSETNPSFCDGFCFDSSLAFKMRTPSGKWQTCDWVKKRPTTRCKKGRISKSCPSACDTCDICSDSPLKFKWRTSSGVNIKDCSWVGENTANRCRDDFALACRKTCGLCDA